MDGPWHRPCQPTHKGQKTTDCRQIQPTIAAATRKIQESPRDPAHWLARAGLLKAVGFPDLATGDVHKAWLLVDTSAAYAKLCGCLLNCHAYADALGVHKTWTEKHPSQAVEINSKECLRLIEEGMTRIERMTAGLPEADRKALQSIGHVLVRDYPWMTQEQTQRSPEIRDQVALEVKAKSHDCAELAISNIRGTNTDVWGVEASKNIPAGHLIIANPAIFAAVDTAASLERGITRCCATCALPLRPRGNTKGSCQKCTYCSDTCRTKAESTFHHKLCPATDFAFPLLHPGVPPTPSVRLDLFARFLSTLIAETNPVASTNTSTSTASTPNDPLTHALIASLTPNTGGPETHAFNYHEHIVYPTQILQNHGIDIFSTPHWDTWILLTIRRRIDNNNHGTTVHGVYPSMAMFNHSCEPNVSIDEDGEGDVDGRAVLRLRARRDIKEGEELFIRYTGEEGDGLVERRYALMHWLGRECMCSKCVREEAEGR